MRVVSGSGLPLRRSDVDTDQIIPAEWLKRVERTGFERGLFATWRDDRDFVLNDERYRQARVIVAGPAFGVGSSREHAVWAIQQYGFEAVIAPSFSDIFHTNCTKNGLVPVTASEEVVERIWRAIEDDPETEIVIDLERLVLEVPAIGLVEEIQMDPRRPAPLPQRPRRRRHHARSRRGDHRVRATTAELDPLNRFSGRFPVRNDGDRESKPILHGAVVSGTSSPTSMAMVVVGAIACCEQTNVPLATPPSLVDALERA